MSTPLKENKKEHRVIPKNPTNKPIKEIINEHLSDKDQAHIRANKDKYKHLGWQIDRKMDELGVSSEQKEQLGEIPKEKWDKIIDNLRKSPNYDEWVNAPSDKNGMILMSAQETSEMEDIIQPILAGSGAGLSIVAAILGIAVAATATGVGLPLGIVAAIIGLLAAIPTGILFILDLLEPMKSDIEKGGQGGDVFMDKVQKGWRIKKIIIHEGAYIDSLKCEWKIPNSNVNQEGERHGGGGGTEKIITLADDENITELIGSAHYFVDSLSFVTNKKKYGPYGGRGGDSFSLKPIHGAITGFSGRSSSYLDAIGILNELFMDERIYYGGKNGRPFLVDLSNLTKLKRILVYSDTFIDCLQFEWTERDNPESKIEKYGGDGGKLQEIIVFNDDEVLKKITVKTGLYLDSITFETNIDTYGPYGGKGGTQAEINVSRGHLHGFIGRYGKYIEGFGVLLDTDLG